MFENKLQTTNNRYGNIVPFLLGLCCCTNLVYVFQIGGTKVLISTVLSLLIVLYNLFTGRFVGKMRMSLPSNIRLPIIIFFAFVLFSVFPAMLYFLGSTYFVRYIYGIIELIGFVLISLAVVLCYEKKDQIKKGLAWGLIINILVSCISIVQKRPGAAPGIYTAILKIFPQTISGIYSYGAYRPMGLFFESSYFIGFLIIAGFLLIPNEKTTWKRYGYLLSIILMIAYSRSGNILIAFACIFIFWCFSKVRVTFRIKKSTLLLAMLIFLVAGVWFLFYDGYESFTTAIQVAIGGGSLENSSPRWNNIKRIIGVLPSVPIGCGWNMTNTYMEVYQSHLIDVTDAYSRGTSSFLLTLLMEVGVGGALAYCFFIGNSFFDLVNKKLHSKERLGVAIALLAMVLLQFLNGVKYFPHFMLVIGIVLCEVSQSRNSHNK